MIDLKLLEKRGINHEGLKKHFLNAHLDATPNTDPESGASRLCQRFADRITAARDFNATHYQLFYALDLAYDAGFQQITPTMLSSLVDKSADDPEVERILATLGQNMEDVLEEEPDPKTPGQNIKKVNVPAFFRIIVPLVSSYVKIRWAKIMNDRRLVPFLKYEPAVSNPVSRMRCEVITARMEQMSRQFGYFDVEKQSCFRMLHYGECLRLPMEEWYEECAEVKDPGDGRVKGEKTKDGAIKVVMKEGMRYSAPHPTRYYYDRSYFPSTINSDTGCQFYGGWKVMRWGDVRQNKNFYNLDKVGHGKSSEWFSTNSAFWKNVNGGCELEWPGGAAATAEASNTGVSKQDSEKHLITGFYQNDDDDKAVVITEHFEKLVPKDWGLGDYEYPVWFRFVIAGDGAVIYAAPLPYSPGVFYGYDMAEGRTRVQSMSLEVLPFQDQFSNLLTQHLLTVRQNLTNLVLVDKEIVDEEDIKKLENNGERWWRKLNFFRFSSKKHQKAGLRSDMAVVPQRFPVMNTAELINAMKIILDTLERVLVMSSQEVGQAASHEQTAEEVKNVAQNTNTRVTFTETAMDIGREAWKRQLYQALMAYGQDEFYAQVPLDEPVDGKTLEELGFSYAAEKEKSYDPKERKATLKVPKIAISYESFASERDGNDRINNRQIAMDMLNFLEVVTKNPQSYQAIGAEQIIQISNNIARLAGFPRDFQLQPSGEIGPNELQQQMMQMFQQLQQDIQGAVQELGTVNNQQNEQIQGLDSSLQALLQQMAQLQQMTAGAPAAPAQPAAQFDPSLMAVGQ